MTPPAGLTLAALERDLGQDISRARTLHEVLKLCLDAAIGAAGMDCGGVYLVDERDGALILEVHRGLPEAFVAQTRRREPDSDHARLVMKGQPYYGTYRGAPVNIDGIREKEGLGALAVLPVVFHDRVIACLNLASHVLDDVPQEARQFGEHLATYIAPFIAQAQGEHALRQAHDELARLFDALSDMVFIIDLDGRIVHTNAAVSQRLGYSRQQLIGRPATVMHPEARRTEAEAVLQAMVEDKISVCTVPLLTADGHLVEVETRVARGIYMGEPILLGTSRDMTQLRAAEAARLEMERRALLAQKQQSLGTMAGAIAHHFNNLMGAVLGNLELLQEDLSGDSPLAARVAEAMAAASRAAEMSSAMLVYLGKDTKNKALCDLSEEVRRSLPLLEAFIPDGVRLRTVLSGSLPIVWADALALRQVLVNLVVNAWESLDTRGGEVRVGTLELLRDGQPVGSVEGIDPVEAGRYVALVVEDNGCGMSADTMRRAFDPFFSTKFTGRGLGLPTVLGIAKAHGGGLEIESVEGRGTTVRLLLPVTGQ